MHCILIIRDIQTKANPSSGQVLFGYMYKPKAMKLILDTWVSDCPLSLSPIMC